MQAIELIGYGRATADIDGVPLAVGNVCAILETHQVCGAAINPMECCLGGSHIGGLLCYGIDHIPKNGIALVDVWGDVHRIGWRTLHP